MLDRHRHADRTILVFHQLNRTYHNAANSQLAQRNLQDVNNPMVLFVLFQALEREAELLHVSPATVANSLKSLERGGYVRKEADPADARCNRVFLTDRGRRAVQECAEVFDAVDQQVLRGFSPGELEQLRSFHQRMLDNLRQIGGDCTPCCPAHSPFSNGKE